MKDNLAITLTSDLIQAIMFYYTESHFKEYNTLKVTEVKTCRSTSSSVNKFEPVSIT